MGHSQECTRAYKVGRWVKNAMILSVLTLWMTPWDGRTQYNDTRSHLILLKLHWASLLEMMNVTFICWTQMCRWESSWKEPEI